MPYLIGPCVCSCSPESYWGELTPQRVFLARVFSDKCKEKEDVARLEAQLPLTTAMAFRIQDTYNALVQHIQDEETVNFIDADDEEAHARREEARLELEITLGELLRTALNCDLAGDEVGRRKMFQTVRGMLVQHVLPEALLPRALEVLRELSPSEQDLIRVVVEIVHELRDPPEEESDAKLEADETISEFGSPRRPRMAPPPKPVSEMSPEEKHRADQVDLRCLSLCIGMLERVNGVSL